MELINATLVVQCVHFLIAYIVLKKVVFMPAVTIVQREQAERDKEQKAIEQALLDVQTLEEHNERAWQQCHQRVAEKIPSPKERRAFTVTSSAPALAPPSIADAVLAEVKKDLSKTIVTLVDHGE